MRRKRLNKYGWLATLHVLVLDSSRLVLFVNVQGAGPAVTMFHNITKLRAPTYLILYTMWWLKTILLKH